MPERVLSNGVRLHWREAGDASKPPLIWIHGGSVEDASMMLPDLEPFLGRVRALCPDARGHGLSTKFERAEDYTYPRKADDMLRWCEALGIERAVWGGASMGAALSLWLAAHAPARVRAVISISGPPYAPPAADVAWWRTHRPLVERGRLAEFFDANVRLRMGEDALARLKARAERYAEMVERLRTVHTSASLLALLDETYARGDWLADCARIRCPVLVIAGSEDHFPTVAMSRRLADAIPGARLAVIAGGGHFPNRTHRAEVQAEMARFLDEIGV
ncbi:MAG TPA: alpha/beta hydrolase [Methylomirabilota bacterium]|nr:alpha/beta hydrolase [Methylomirabilota bacterium]